MVQKGAIWSSLAVGCVIAVFPLAVHAEVNCSDDLLGAKIAEIEAACKAAGSSEEACNKSRGEIRDLLNDDQKAKFDASWEKLKAGKQGGCG